MHPTPRTRLSFALRLNDLAPELDKLFLLIGLADCYDGHQTGWLGMSLTLFWCRGLGPVEETHLPINILEQFGYPFIVGPLILGGHLTRIQSEYTTALAYVDPQGANRSLAAKRKGSLILLWVELCQLCMSQAWKIFRQTFSVINI